MSLFLSPLKKLKGYKDIENDIRNKNIIHITDLIDAAKAYLITEVCKEKSWRLLITYDEERAARFYEDISCFYENVYLYPAKDLLFFSADIRGSLITEKRIEIYKKISTEDEGIIICSIDALMDKMLPFESFKSSIINIDENDRINIEDLSKKLAAIGYERVYTIEAKGQFSVRGGIIDIYPVTESLPIRIELWDDTIDSMRSFDISSQRSIENVSAITVYPAKESEVREVSFLSYMAKENSMVFMDEILRVREKAADIEKDFNESMSDRLELEKIEKDEVPSLFSVQECMQEILEYAPVLLSSLERQIKGIGVKNYYSLESRQIPAYQNAFELMIEELQRLKSMKHYIVLITASKTRAKRLTKSLSDMGLNAYYQEDVDEDYEPKPSSILVLYGQLHTGFEFPEIKFSIISESDIFNKHNERHKKKDKKRDTKGIELSSLTELNVGDYVIHEEHGLGIYRGIEQIERDYIIKDYIKIEYAGGDNCYIPVTKLDLVQKYSNLSSAETKKTLKLNKLGGADWTKAKVKAKKAIDEIAKDLVKLYANRLYGKGHVYAKDGDWQREFEELFPYEETDDQLKAIEDTKRDMEQGKIMDRLICGDVGYGKTEIALRAAFKAVNEGFQVLYLVPTTILAQQHYNTFFKRMQDFPIKVELLCRFRTAGEQKKIVKEFNQGFVDIVIGTHRILSKDMEPKKLGLVVVDEEQRFGVKHKEKLKKLRESVNVLTLTATPIPRTLHMSLAGIRDLNVLKEAPMDRKPIQTYVCEYSDYVVREAIKRELARGGQVYYIYNRVGDIAEFTGRLAKLLPDANILYAHGQMSERELEDIMLDFMSGAIDVLVSTTIVETGLDIPNANTILIHDADRLGLSQLYQLRGRVGRSSRSAYAFLLYRKDKLLSEESSKRLKAIKEFTELGSGIKIALRDLEIRGAGSVLGESQHGHMQAIGYDMYCKLLNRAIGALKGEESYKAEYETSIELESDAYIPGSYIGDEEQKLDIYKRIASISSKEEYIEMQDELIDRFGEIPRAVENLLKAARLKNLAHNVYITDVVVNTKGIRLSMSDTARIEVDDIEKILKMYEPDLSINTKDNPKFTYKEKNTGINCEKYMDKALELVINMNEILLKP